MIRGYSVFKKNGGENMGKGKEVKARCPDCGTFIYKPMPFRKEGVKVLVTCEECGTTFEA